MSLIFRSKLIRNEITHWALVVALLLWALTASLYSFSKKDQLILIALDENGTHLITKADDRLLQLELKNFIQNFISTFYDYDEKSFSEKMNKATDLMSEPLWLSQKENIQKIQKNLQENPLSQTPEIESLDLIGDSKIEALVGLKVTSRLREEKVFLKVTLEFKKHERSLQNPWGYEVINIYEVLQ
jgi:hypothetical protein